MVGKKIVLRHYSKVKPISCIGVSGTLDGFFTIKLSDSEFKSNEFCKGDPILLGTQSANSIDVSGGNIISVNKKQGLLILSTDKVIESNVERRVYERHSVSILANLKVQGAEGKAEVACVKDLSYIGAKIYTKRVLNPDEVVDVDLLMADNVFRLEARVVRTSMCFGRNEVGLQLIHRAKDGIHTTRDYIDNYISHESYLLEKHLLAGKF
jgi:hypothetical protein